MFKCLHRITIFKYTEILVEINEAYFKLFLFKKKYPLIYRGFLWVEWNREIGEYMCDMLSNLALYEDMGVI
jgi:nitrate reductase assembly molybdenum cofactor insertion protein NarJ